MLKIGRQFSVSSLQSAVFSRSKALNKHQI